MTTIPQTGDNDLNCQLPRLLLFCFLLLTACGETSPAIYPAGLEPVTPITFTISAGSALEPLPAVLVRGSDKQPLEGVRVTFRFSGGILKDSVAISDKHGVATLRGWRNETRAGEYQLSAVIAGPQVIGFVIRVVPGPPAEMIMVSGDSQSGDLGLPLDSPLGVRLKDGYGNPLNGAAVSFRVITGGARLPEQILTGPDGVASAPAVLTQPGKTLIQVESPGTPGVIFSLDTGPTIMGMVTDAALLQNRSGGPPIFRGQASVRLPGKSLLTLPDWAPATSLYSPAALARRTSPGGRLIVSFNRSSSGVAWAAMAERGNLDLLRQSTLVYQEILAPHLRGIRLAEETRIMAPIGAARVVLHDPADQARVIAALRSDRRVIAVEEDGVESINELPSRVSQAFSQVWQSRAGGSSPATETYPQDPFFPQQFWHYRLIDLPRTWKLATGSSRVRVGVLDTGIRPDHPQLEGVVSLTEGYDFVDGLSAGWSEPQQLCSGGSFQTFRGPAPWSDLPRTGLEAMQLRQNGSCWIPDRSGSHGTHVAGTIASAADDGIGGVGVNWNATIIPIRIAGSAGGMAWRSDVIQGLLYAGGYPATWPGAPADSVVQIEPVPIVNISIGGTTYSAAYANTLALIAPTTLVIASAGNGGNSSPQYPAAYPGVVGVSGLGPDQAKTPSSSYGSFVDLAAPGGNVALGGSSAVFSAAWDFATMKPIQVYKQGTSMAAPHVAGVAALIKAVHPEFTPEQIRQRLYQGAVDLGPPGRDDVYGHGLVNAYRSVTGTSGPVRRINLRLMDTAGAVVRDQAPDPSGRFAFTRLMPGTYRLLALTDEEGDGAFGVPIRPYGATAVLRVAGTQPLQADLVLGYAEESEPNNQQAEADYIMLDTWIRGTLGPGDPLDIYVFDIPAVGTYTMETSGQDGACGYARDARTSLRLLSSTGTLVKSNTATAWPDASYPGQYCSLIRSELQPGRYFLEVTAASGVNGQYRLHLRSGE